jgi:hypothetical protein
MVIAALAILAGSDGDSGTSDTSWQAMMIAALAILLAGSDGDTFVIDSMALCSYCYTIASCITTSHTIHTRNQTYRTLYSTHIYCRRQDVKQAPQNIVLHIYRLTGIMIQHAIVLFWLQQDKDYEHRPLEKCYPRNWI